MYLVPLNCTLNGVKMRTTLMSVLPKFKKNKNETVKISGGWQAGFDPLTVHAELEILSASTLGLFHTCFVF